MCHNVFRGLVNLGNTCFINSVLQACYHSLDLKYRIEPCTVNNNDSLTLSERISIELINVFTEMRNNESLPQAPVVPYRFVELIKLDPRFTGSRQQDAAEFLQVLIEHLLCIDSKVLTRDEQLQTCGEMTNITTCKTCGTINRVTEHFNLLLLDLPMTPTSLSECISQLNTKESVDGINCDVCTTKQTKYKQSELSKLPDVLIIVLKRFAQDTTKNGVIVDIPMGLNFHYPLTNNDNDGPIESYSLHTIVDHNGTEASSGHYSTRCLIDHSIWYHIDDTRVHLQTGLLSLGSSSAYISIYKKQPSKLTPPITQDLDNNNVSTVTDLLVPLSI